MTVALVLKVSTNIITSIAVLPIILAEMLMIISVSTVNTAIFLYTVEPVNPTHQGSREMRRIVQDVGILRFYFS